MSQRTSISVLLIDDDESDRALYRAYLSDAMDVRCEILEASTAARGVELAVEMLPDCILVDYRLPDADGLEILERLDGQRALTERAVVMLTGHGDERICAAAMRRGALDYAPKAGLTADQLARIVTQAVELSDRRRDIGKSQAALARRSFELELAKIHLEHAVAELRTVNSRLQQAHAAADEQVTHDPVTHLPNQRLFDHYVRDAIGCARRYDEIVAIVYLGIHGADRIRDALGRECADELMCSSARRLEECVRESDIVARVGTAELAVILRRLDGETDGQAIAHKVVALLSEPHDAGMRRVPLAWSAGVAVHPRDAVEPTELILRAQAALCDAIRSGAPVLSSSD